MLWKNNAITVHLRCYALRNSTFIEDGNTISEASEVAVAAAHDNSWQGGVTGTNNQNWAWG